MADQDFQQVFADTPAPANCRVSVVVPVRDEEASIWITLQAFADQILPPEIESGIIEFLLLANNCTDDSADIIRQFIRENSKVPVRLAEIHLAPEQANIGYVRRLLMNAAFERLHGSRRERSVIMTTDADTIVAPDWIAATLQEIELGADAVGGRIIIAGSELAKMDAAARRMHLLDDEYRLLAAELEALIDELPFDNGARHYQHFNASIALTTDAYRISGGVPHVECMEDCALFERLERADLKVRHSPDVRVYTSGRSTGRSRVGLAYQIGDWQRLAGEGKELKVESVPSLIDRFTIKRELRRLWLSGETPSVAGIRRLSDLLSVPQHLIKEGLALPKPFGEVYGDFIREQTRLGIRDKKFPLESVATVVRELSSEIEIRASCEPFPHIKAVGFRSMSADVS